jgi:FKBP-type peptidyl-prolyl cis-trans isomerase SlyD
MSEKVVADGLVVIMQYTLRGDDGEVLDASTPDDPMAYLHGAENIVPGLENALLGKGIGFKGKVVVSPEDGYGERDEDDEPDVIPRKAFPPDMEIEPGMTFMAEGPDNEHAPIWVVAVEGDKILVDSQHPLAGKTLHFEVEILGIRPATKDELAHGHPHGPDGHSGHGHAH